MTIMHKNHNQTDSLTSAPWLLIGSTGPCTDKGLVLPVGSAADNGTNSFLDAENAASDSLSQLLTTVPGVTYTLNFYDKLPVAVPSGYTAAIRVLASDFNVAPINLRLDSGYDSGASSSDGITYYQYVWFRGTAVPRQLVNIYVNGVISGSQYAAEDGSFYVPGSLALGNNTINAQISYQGIGGPLSAPYYAVYQVSGPIPIPTLAPSSDTGNKGDKITHLTTITLQGTADSGNVVMYGYDAYGGGSAQSTALSNGSYSITFTNQALGQHGYYIIDYDLAGNSHYSYSNGYLYITVVAIPSTPALVNTVWQTGVANIDTSTMVYFTATGTPGNTLTIYENGVAIKTAALGSDASNSANTQASFAFLPTRAGVLTYNATQTDSNGEVSLGSNTFTITVHPLAPVLLRLQGFSGTPPNITTADIATLVGTDNAGALVTILNGNSTAAASGLAVNGTFAIALPTQPVGYRYFTANASLNGQYPLNASNTFQITVNPVAPIITGIANTTGSPPNAGDTAIPKNFTGTAYPNATIVFTDENNQVVAQGTSDSLGRFTVPVSAYFAVGSHSLVAVQTVTIQGTNFVSVPSAAFPFIVVTSAPANLGLQAQPGKLNPTITTGDVPIVTGTASANAIILIKDGAQTIAAGSADGQGSFAITLKPLTLGNHTITAIADQDDADGNTSVSPKSSPPLVVRVVTPPPVSSSTTRSIMSALVTSLPSSASPSSSLSSVASSGSRISSLSSQPPSTSSSNAATTTVPADLAQSTSANTVTNAPTTTASLPICSNITMVMHLTTSTITMMMGAAGAGAGGSGGTGTDGQAMGTITGGGGSMMVTTVDSMAMMESMYGCMPVATSTAMFHMSTTVY